MPNPITALPDLGSAPTGQTWVDAAWAQIDGLTHERWLLYALAGVLLLLLTVSLISRRKRGKQDSDGEKQALTRTDRAITRITGILATAVVATGAWKVFGLPALHLAPVFRVALFAFAEAQVIAAWRRVRRHIFRHAELGAGTRTIYGIALGSATVAAFDASATVEVLLRFFAAFVAAYMIVEELAEELDIYLTENEHLRTEARKKPKRGLFGLKWALTPERIMVWLRLAESTEHTIEEVERQRRIARMARTAYRLQVLKDAEAKAWRIGWARRSLRRQTESANAHLNIAGDVLALDAVRTQLALLFEVEDRTTRDAVADASPLRTASQAPRTEIIDGEALSESERSQETSQAASPTAKPAGRAPEIALGFPFAKPSEKAPANAAKLPAKPAHPLADHPNESVRRLARAFARKPGATNADLAKQARVSPGTANRYMAEVRQAFATRGESTGDSQLSAQAPRIELPIPEPVPLATAGQHNGSRLTPEEN